MRTIAWIIFTLSVLGLLFCLYSYLFWTWVTATPLSPAQLARAQYNGKVWLALGAVSFVLAIVSLVVVIRSFKERRGFPMDPPND
jgi:hypothetical protein